MIRFKDSNFPIYLLILILGLSPLLWFQSGKIIDGGDINLAIHPADFMSRLLYSWDNRDSAGVSNSQSFPLLFPYTLFFVLFQYLGFSLPTIQKIWFIFIFVLSGFSMFYLVFSLTKDRFAGFISAVLYMYNIPKVDRWFAGDFHAVLMAGVIPMILLFLIRGLDVKAAKIKYCILIAFLSLFFTHWNPSSTVAVSIIFFIYFLFHSWITKFKLLNANLKFIGITTVLVILLNIYWICPLIKYLSSGVSVGLSQAISGDLGWLQGASRNGSFLRLLRLSGEWFWNMPYKGEEQAAYSISYLQNPWLILISFTIPLFAFSALLLKPKNKFVIFFSISAIIYIFLDAGTHFPTGGIYEWLFKHLPGFSLFRSPYQKFSLMIAFSYAFLIGITAGKIYEFFKRKNPHFYKIHHSEKIFTLTIVAIILITAWPLFTTYISHNKGKIIPTFLISTPKYYEEADDWLSQSKKVESRLLVLPNVDGAVSYNWGYSGGTDIVQHLLKMPQISGTSSLYSRAFLHTYDFLVLLYEAINEGRFESVYKILGLLNIDKILLRSDLNRAYCEVLSTPQESKNMLDSSPSVSHEKSFGKLDFYSISGNYFLPHIYASQNFTFVSSDIGAIESLAQTIFFEKNPALFFIGKKLDSEKMRYRSLYGGQNINFVFVDVAWKDLAVELAMRKDEGEIDNTGIYEIYIDVSKLTNEIAGLTVNIDGGNVGLYYGLHILDSGRRFVKVDELKLKEGRHIIRGSWTQNCLKNSMTGPLQLVLVNKIEREGYERVIWKNLNQPKTKVGYIFSDDEREFYVP